MRGGSASFRGDRRLIGYSQINRRFYYKPEEVKRLIPLVGTLYPGGK